MRDPTSPHYDRVRQFMELAGQEVPSRPGIPNEETRLLRARLILEEALETVEALGVTPLFSCAEGEKEITSQSVRLHADREPSLLDIIDGCCDTIVVTTGTLIACGVPDVPFQEAVDQNNLAKFGPGSYRRDDGKWVKPADHPDVKDEFERLLSTI